MPAPFLLLHMVKIRQMNTHSIINEPVFQQNIAPDSQPASSRDPHGEKQHRFSCVLDCMPPNECVSGIRKST